MFRTCAFLFLFLIPELAIGQRNYVPNSVLGKGEWFKVAIEKQGIYKIDYGFLKSMGIKADGLPSSSIRLYGNGGQMMPEKTGADIQDDLTENAIQVFDGGDQVFNQGDYFLFYAGGPDAWLKDSVNRKFIHQENLYSDLSFYFITTGGTGKRISPVTPTGNPWMVADSYDERYYFERDSLNLLSSGKNWYGPQFNAGATEKRSFQLPIDELVNGAPAILVTKCIARSVGADSRFNIKMNNATLLQMQVPAVTSSSYDLFARETANTTVFQPQPPYILDIEFSSGAFGAQGWLDWFEVFARRKLVMKPGSPLFFRDWASVKNGETAGFIVAGARDGTQVWDISEPNAPRAMTGNLAGNNFSFNNGCSELREYVAFSDGFLTPQPIGRVKNQDIHAAGHIDYLVVTHPSFLGEATRLAAYHAREHLTSLVVSIDEIYNEFASGSPDPSAIRNFVKMFYDRAGPDSSRKPKYLLLFGDASYDYKNRLNNNKNLIPPYESVASLDPLSSYTSDDYFGFLDDWEDINDGNAGNLLDIGIGRIPAQNLSQAKAYVDKVLGYKDPVTLGSWRNELTFIADDEDFNLHLEDAETVTASAAAVNPLFLYNKIYLDAFKQESHSSGSRYPLVNQAIEKKVEAGTLILNYNGHGGFRRLAEEVVLDQGILDTWYNPERLPLFITATCDFAPYDNPSVFSLGEEMLVKKGTGAIALMTTTRLVFAYSNRIMNEQYLQVALARKSDGMYRTLGEAVRETKNNTYQFFSDITNNRKFTLLGDPALRLNFPAHRVRVTEINGKTAGSVPDTLKALQVVKVKGEVADYNDRVINSFNGTVQVAVYDKAERQTTLANDPGSLKENFQSQQNALFKGKSTVKDGVFEFSFSVPKDINYQGGNGKISLYAENGSEDGNGSFTGFVIAGSLSGATDTSGPQMHGWLENRQFLNGYTVGKAPLLIVDLNDSSGINISNNGSGHEIVAVLDGDTKNSMILNDWFSFDKDSYRRGTLVFQLPLMEEGKHSITIKSWDNANNSAVLVLHFNVKKEESILEAISNYPNPVTSGTRFCFTHKRPGGKLEVSVRIFNPQGQLIKSIERTINTHGSRSCDIEWGGLDDQGRTTGKGIYIYNIEIRGEDGVVANKSKKLIVM